METERIKGGGGLDTKRGRYLLSAEKTSKSHVLLKRPEMQKWGQELQESERPHVKRENSNQEDAHFQNCH